VLLGGLGNALRKNLEIDAKILQFREISHEMLLLHLYTLKVTYIELILNAATIWAGILKMCEENFMECNYSSEVVCNNDVKAFKML